MAKIEESDPNQKVLWVKAANGQVEDIVDVQAYDGTSYFKIDKDGNVSIVGSGNVNGPGSSTDNAITRFDGTTGKVIQNSTVTISDAGTVNIPTGQTYDINGVPHTHATSGGDVVGPSGATDEALARFDTATGKLIQNSLVTVSDTGTVNVPSGQTYNIDGVAHSHATANHALTNSVHAETGLTTGHFLKATGATTFAFGAHGLTYADVGASASGHNHDSDYVSVISTPTAGNLPTITAGGELQNSAYSPSSFAASGHNHDSDYISIVGTPTTGNFPQLTAGGELVNSTYDETSFATSGHNHSGTYINSETTPTDHAVVRWDGVGGADVQNSLVSIDDNGSINIPSGQAYKINNVALAASDVGAASSSHNHDSDYISVVGTPTAGNFPTLTAGGELQNSVYSNSSFAASSHNHAGADINSGTIDGDRLPAMSTTKKGGVPATGTPAGLYLKDDGTWSAPSGAGDVVGPAGATDNGVARYNGTSGTSIQDSLVTIADSTGAIFINSHQAITDPGTASGKYLRDDGTWNTVSGSGDVVGPSSATDHAFARFDTGTGKLIQNSLVTADDSGSVNIPSGQSYKINNVALAASDVGAATSSHNHDSDYISVVSTPTTGNFPQLTAGGELTNSSYDETSFATSGHNHDGSYVKDPGSSVDEQVLRWNGITGDTIQACLMTVSDTGSPNIPTGETYNINGSPHTHTGFINDPGSSVDNEILRWDSTSGDTVQASQVTIDDNGTINIPLGQTYNINGSNHTHTAGDVGLSNVTNDAQVKKLAVSIDNQVLRWDGVNGDTVQQCLMTVDDTGSPNIPSGQTYNINGTAHNHEGAYIAAETSPTDNAVVRWDSTTGDDVQNSLVTIDDSGSVNIPSGQYYKINGTAHTHATAAHNLTNAVHAETGLTSGYFLKATGEDTFAWAAHGLTNSDVGAAAATHYHAGADITSGTVDGDRLPAISTTKKGGVPATGTPTGLFLKDDGTWAAPSGSGDVVGPAGATDNALPRFNTATGKLIQDSVITVADTTGALSINAHQALTDPGASPSGKYLRDDGTWQTIAAGGDVSGPPSSTDNAIARFDSTTGKIIQNSLVVIDDAGSMSIPAGQSYGIAGVPHTHIPANVGLGNVDNVAQVYKGSGVADHAFVRWDGTTGSWVQNSLVSADDSGSVNIPTGQTYNINGSAHSHSHTALSDIGTNAHSTIDSHLASTANPHSTTASQVGAIADPGTSVDEQVLRWNGTSGDTVQACLLTVSDTGTCNIPSGQTYNINGSAHTHTASDIGLGNVTNNAQIKDPGSSVDNQVLRWDGTTGDTVQACLLTVDDTGTCNIPSGQTYNINGTAHTHTGLVTNGDSHDHSGGDGAQIAHTALSAIGTNAHSVIDTHLASTSNPHSTTAAQVGAIADPGTSVDEQVLRWNGTSGDTVQACLLTVSDTGTCNIPSGQTYNINGSAHTHTASAVGAIADPGSSVDEQVLRWNGTGGDTVQACLLTVDDSGSTNIPTGQTYKINGTAHGHSATYGISFVIDGGGSAITTGKKGHVEVPFAATVTGWSIVADVSGSIVVDVNRSTYSGFPTTSSIAGTELPTLSSVQKNQDLSLSSWTTSLAAGDILEFEVDSATTVTRVTVALQITRSV